MEPTTRDEFERGFERHIQALKTEQEATPRQLRARAARRDTAGRFTTAQRDPQRPAQRPTPKRQMVDTIGGRRVASQDSIAKVTTAKMDAYEKGNPATGDRLDGEIHRLARERGAAHERQAQQDADLARKKATRTSRLLPFEPPA